MQVPASLEHLQLPAFTLQPIVENAIKHGTSQHLGVGEITIRASQHERWLQLDVEDNAGLYRDNPNASGLGMSPWTEDCVRASAPTAELASLAKRNNTPVSRCDCLWRRMHAKSFNRR